MWEELKKKEGEKKEEKKTPFSIEWDSENSKTKLFALFYGSDGTGKTGLALSYPIKNEEGIVVVDLDGGAIPLKSFHANKKIYIKNPTVISEEGKINYEETLKTIMKIVAWVKENHEKEKIELFVFDGLSTLLKMCEYTMRLRIDKDMGEGVEIRYWQIRNKLFNEIITAIKALPVNTIIISHEDFIMKEENNSAIKMRVNQMAFQKFRFEKIEGLKEITYKVKVDKSKYQPKLEGKVFDLLKIGEDKYEWLGENIWNDVLGGVKNE